MAFSSALTLTDLNDYLGPSQACIKPVSGKDAPKSEDATNIEDTGAAPTQIAIDNGVYFEEHQVDNSNASTSGKPRARTRLETAEISLEDCLACSGCLTSAETVLIGLQSVDELRKVVATKGQADGPTHLVASISPQSIASLSTKYSSSPSLMLSKVEDYLRNRLGFHSVSDTSFARHISLDEQAREYTERKQLSQIDGSSPTLPMLASSCPGWICYAEKTHGELIPLISKTRSPQQIAGLLAKRYVVETTGLEEAPRIYHMTIMPCYDKKLEASRQDFFDDVTKTRDVDLVITTGELDEMMQADAFDITSADAEMIQNPPTPPHSDGGDHAARRLPSLLQHPGSSSGSYLFDLIKRIWQNYIAEVGPGQPSLVVNTIRSADYTEYILRAPASAGSQILFKGAQCYGFRNLQNLVRKVQKQTGIKSKKSSAALIQSTDLMTRPSGREGPRGRGKVGMVRRGRGGALGASRLGNMPASQKEIEESQPYDFVEVMACPGGCVNGGGQIRPTGDAGASSSLTSRAITVDVTEALADSQLVAREDLTSEKEGSVQPFNKHLDPEGFTSGWMTPAASSTTSEDVDMYPPSRDESGQEAEIAGWKGTAKEWVRLVENQYWTDGRDKFVTSVHQGQALGYNKERISAEIFRALESLAIDGKGISQEFTKIADIVVAEMCQRRGKESKRSDILRTQYRAVQDDAVSGLAVQW